jgi:hypothetical protein
VLVAKMSWAEAWRWGEKRTELFASRGSAGAKESSQGCSLQCRGSNEAEMVRVCPTFLKLRMNAGAPVVERGELIKWWDALDTFTEAKSHWAWKWLASAHIPTRVGWLRSSLLARL